jgi:hypothetical protein
VIARKEGNRDDNRVRFFPMGYMEIRSLQCAEVKIAPSGFFESFLTMMIPDTIILSLDAGKVKNPVSLRV